MDKLQLQKNEIDLLVISIFPTRKATINFQVFDRILSMYQGVTVEVSEWAALALVETRKKVREGLDQIKTLEDEALLTADQISQLGESLSPSNLTPPSRPSLLPYLSSPLPSIPSQPHPSRPLNYKTARGRT